MPGYQVGEIAIGPIQPAQLACTMKKYYPSMMDASCGLHVHMSFDTLRYYSLLMTPEYQETIVEYLRKWAVSEGFPNGHLIYERLKGQSVYCQKKYWPD